MSIFRKGSTAATPTDNDKQALTLVETASQMETGAAPKALRQGSKGAALLELLTRERGASLDEMIERTGWLSHTVRAAMTGLRKKGHTIDKRVSGNTTVWFIAS